MVITGPGNFGGSSGIGGSYTINNVPAGTYGVTASKAYYVPSTSTNVVVVANQTTTRNLSITGTPPSNVTNFVVSAGNTTNHLDWTNPSSANTSGVMIRFKTTGYPTGPTDGTLVTNRPGGPSLADNYDHTGLTNGTTSYYTAFAYFADASTYYASGVNASGLPAGPGDYDRDGDVDMSDFGYFQRCISGLAVFPAPGCAWADLNPSGGDSDVDGQDTNAFIGCISGPDNPANPSCAP
jgi:hypothetical protein